MRMGPGGINAKSCVVFRSAIGIAILPAMAFHCPTQWDNFIKTKSTKSSQNLNRSSVLSAIHSSHCSYVHYLRQSVIHRATSCPRAVQFAKRQSASAAFSWVYSRSIGRSTSIVNPIPTAPIRTYALAIKSTNCFNAKFKFAAATASVATKHVAYERAGFVMVSCKFDFLSLTHSLFYHFLVISAFHFPPLKLDPPLPVHDACRQLLGKSLSKSRSFASPSPLSSPQTDILK